MAAALALGVFFALLQADLGLSLGPLTVYHTELALALLLPWALWQAPAAERKAWGYAFAPVALWLLAHLGADGFKAFLRAAQFAAAAALPLLLMRSTRAFSLVLRAAFFCGSLSSLWALLQTLLGPFHPLNAGRGLEVLNGFQMAAAGYSHHNQLGAFLAPFCLLALMAWQQGWERHWALAGLSLGLAALLCSYSRGAWAGLAAGAALLALGLPARWRRGLGLLAAAALALALLGPWAGLRSRLLTLFSDSDRIEHLRSAWALWEGHAWWGWGVEGLQQEALRLARAFRAHDASQAAFGFHLHNSYLQWGLTWGWPVLLAWAIFLAALLRRAFERGPGPWAWALAGAMAAFLLQSATDLLTLHARGMAVAFLWGLLLAGARLKERHAP